MRLHPQLPPTLMWGYDGRVPGPTIEVRRGQRVRIAWTNRIPEDSEYPVTSVEVMGFDHGAAHGGHGEGHMG